MFLTQVQALQDYKATTAEPDLVDQTPTSMVEGGGGGASEVGANSTPGGMDMKVVQVAKAEMGKHPIYQDQVQ